ncbi:3-phosphoshikimate 1-carboxyvinyltransferase [Paenimyroides baculatum]|uniref:3-phosphoshikimate 1-carboxyvinyltransferase n=1 Tax=Paenimyroides baculatum TaxID=2608000 RepID=A0A5M6CQK9_9FLAO|nr:3-phosphoshikimate 1-carboxyvinyltransferase [Paenimyroides baculatum]KAA5535429.1 3-phosphoshikimate 1-carboxyvinyltransferase [Paenimyroides baculatum]
MNDILLNKSELKNNQEIIISGSKSETNRLLLLQALYPNLKIENASNSDDSEVMKNALQSLGKSSEINVYHAGTAMRFLTSFYAIQEGLEVVISGSDRMHERPTKILVDALNQLGTDISYLKEEGYPPIKIIGKKIQGNKVSIDANVSSQYITSLMLIGSSLPNKLEIQLKGTITSIPYIKMTLSVLQSLGIKAEFKKNIIKIPYTKKLSNDTFVVESDWSSASYFYSLMALSKIDTQITLGYFKQDSLQGDAVLAEIYQNFGVQTTFIDNKIIIKKVENSSIKNLNLNLNNAPDIAQTIIVTCLGLGITCNLMGLHTLKIKETDRLQALKNELEKFGADVSISHDSIQLNNSVIFQNDPIKIETYQDHRMAMAFAPLVLKQSLIIKNAPVVSKSYPDFWNDLKAIGLSVNHL